MQAVILCLLFKDYDRFFLVTLLIVELLLHSMRVLILFLPHKKLHLTFIIELEQGMDMAEISNRIINEITDSYYSLISNDTNSIMKILTIVSVILTIPTIVFSFYGMNVPLPFTQNRLP